MLWFLCVGVRLVRRVTPSSRHASRPVVHCTPTRSGCVRRASTTPTRVRSAAGAAVRSATHLYAPRLTTRPVSLSAAAQGSSTVQCVVKSVREKKRFMCFLNVFENKKKCFSY